jgi:hypothetical protein
MGLTYKVETLPPKVALMFELLLYAFYYIHFIWMHKALIQIFEKALRLKAMNRPLIS